MSRKLILLLLVVFLGWCGAVSAAVYWDNDTGSQAWEDPCNWSGDAGPTTYPAIDIGTPGGPNECIIGAGIDATEATKLWIGYSAGKSGALLLDGGTINCGQFFDIGYNGAGTFTSTGGTVNANKYDIEAAVNAGSSGVVDANNTTFYAVRDVEWANKGDASWTLNNCDITALYKSYAIFYGVAGMTVDITMNNCNYAAGQQFYTSYGTAGTTINITMNNSVLATQKYDIGQMTIASDHAVCTWDVTASTISAFRNMYIGHGKNDGNDLTTMTMDGGLVDVTGNLFVPYGPTASGSIDLKAGTIQFASLRLLDTAPLSHINVDDGVLVRKGGTDYTDTFQGYVDSGLISGWGGRGDTAINYDGTDTILSATAPQWELAYAPDPGMGKTIDTQSVTLGWTEGDYVGDPNKHDVYFGTSFEDVNSATTATAGVYMGRQGAASYGPITGLELGKTYYWRIDEVNEATANVWKGRIWSFSVVDNIIIDDFEDYNNINTGTGYLYELWERYPAPAGSLWATWTDGYDDTLTGSVIYDAQGEVHGGTLGVKFTYDNDGTVTVPSGGGGDYTWYPADYSQIERTSPVTDMTANNIKALGIWYLGDIANASEPMYVALSDGSHTAVVTDPDPNAAKVSVWTHVNIPLAAFTTANPSLDLSNISKIMLGFGNPTSPVSGGSGTVYLDDIQLYVSRCVSAEIPGDLANNDCTITLDDVSAFVKRWLDTSGGLVTATTPDSSKQVLYYTFDDGNSIAADSSGNSADGTTILSLPVWNAAGKNGGCAVMDGTYFISVPTSVFADINDQITIAFWCYGDPLVSIAAWQMAFSACSEDAYYDGLVNNKGGGHVLAFGLPTSGGTSSLAWDAGTADANLFPTGYQWETCTWSNAPATSFRGQWNHFAMTKNIDDGTMKLYCNGLLVSDTINLYSTGEQVPEATLPINHVGEFLIGGWGNYDLPPLGAHYMYFGKMDDFRIYKYALSQAEILSLAGVSSIVQPTADIDFNDDNKINFEDYATLVENWLVEQVWP